MSSIVPGPKKKLEEEITAARSGAKPLDASALSPSAPRQEQLTGLDDFPESLRTAIEAEHTRLTALETNRRKTADRAVPAVVESLDALLTQITDHLGKPRLFGKPTAVSEPTAEATELLGIPSGDLDTSPGRAEHRTALRTLKQLRAQLKDLETTPDHDRLTRLSTLTIRLSVALEATPDSATLIPLALTRFTQAIPDPQWTQTFPEKLATWKQALT
ncbi:hypothetical protein JOF29_001688 [Kribbella aluminosa]|uniref:Uncharacterized protein n=1 Tax=Kribbella aluminosa TaxID=416017 RepID=A0ABS4UG71_9ACTN|nr:hypothetical protein [Kribbella aluminosa]MBP2350605.1 hypothetical protein [Kribbella aluminosa]